MLYRGYNAIELAGKVTFEEVAYLLWEGDLPNRAQLDAFRVSLAHRRDLPEGVIQTLKSIPRGSHPMDVLRTGVSLLAHHDLAAADNSLPAVRRKSEQLLAQLP